VGGKTNRGTGTGLYSFDRWDLPAELEKLHMRVAEVEEERVAKVGELAALVVEASNASWTSGCFLSGRFPKSRGRLKSS
jgi:hypothetical protein